MMYTVANKWHRAESLKGEQCYGQYGNPLNQWSIKYSGTTFNQFLFITADKESWMMMEKEEVLKEQADHAYEERNVLKVSIPEKTCSYINLMGCMDK